VVDIEQLEIDWTKISAKTLCFLCEIEIKVRVTVCAGAPRWEQVCCTTVACSLSLPQYT